MAKQVKGFDPSMLADLESLGKQNNDAAASTTPEAEGSTQNEWVRGSEELVSLLDWADFDGVEAIREWAGRLGEFFKSPSHGDSTDLLGRAALIQTGDEGIARLLARRCAHDVGASFLFIDAESFHKDAGRILEAATSLAPTVAYIEADEWLGNPKLMHSAARHIEQALKACPGLILITGVGNVGKVPFVIRKPGRFDRAFRIPDVTPQRWGRMILSKIGEPRCHPQLLSDDMAKVGKLFRGRSMLEIDLLALHLKRLAVREQKLIELTDVIDFEIRDSIDGGTTGTDPDKVRQQVAYHESGHAVIGIVDSAGVNVPEYASITGADGFKGVVMPSIDAMDQFTGGFVSYRDFRHRVRCALGGRAAEELVYGPEAVCTGASGDLSRATEMAMHMFSVAGFAPDMEKPGQSASNLAVMITEHDVQSLARLHELTRQFLAAEYATTLELLRHNRMLLDKVQQRLLWDPVVDQSELRALIDECPIQPHEKQAGASKQKLGSSTP